MTHQEVFHKQQEKRLSALPISEGVACAPVRLLLRDSGDYVPRYAIDASECAQERARLGQALHAAAHNLDLLIDLVEARVGRAQANIFQAQKMIVLDEMLAREVAELIDQECINAEAACVKVLDAYEARLLELDNDYLKDRASDIGEVRRRILDMFRVERGEEEASFEVADADDELRIVVAEELMPGETVSLNARNTAGFLTERGGAASHVAILARALGIPAVSGVKNLLQEIGPKDRVLLNGATGEVIVNPARQTLNLYPALRRTAPSRFQTAPPTPGFPVMANINVAAETALVREMDAEGIGLYRTEFEFIVADRILSEDEQFERYAQVVRDMQGLPVYIRLADLGGDKAARFLSLPPEDNPALGYRGARLLLGQPELLSAQARAIARASRLGPIHVIYPMVVDEQQFLKLRTRFMQSIHDLKTGSLSHGVMFEVPAACVCAVNLLRAADFGSIGTNDLVQYLYAVDRDNGLVSNDYNPDQPAFWKTIEFLVAAAAAAGKLLAVCGEMGGQPQFLPKLIARGIRSVSVSPRLIGLARITAKRAGHIINAQGHEGA